MALVKYSPQGLLNNWLGSYFNDDGYRPTSRFQPSLDIEERKKDYLVRLDIPGLEKGQIDVVVEDGVLTVSGERKSSSPTEDIDHDFAERTYGKFSRSLRLPQDVPASDVDANLKNGVLEISVKKPKALEAKQITVN